MILLCNTVRRRSAELDVPVAEHKVNVCSCVMQWERRSVELDVPVDEHR
jgi:hypothetical protein